MGAVCSSTRSILLIQPQLAQYHGDLLAHCSSLLRSRRIPDRTPLYRARPSIILTCQRRPFWDNRFDGRLRCCRRLPDGNGYPQRKAVSIAERDVKGCGSPDRILIMYSILFVYVRLGRRQRRPLSAAFEATSAALQNYQAVAPSWKHRWCVVVQLVARGGDHLLSWPSQMSSLQQGFVPMTFRLRETQNSVFVLFLRNPSAVRCISAGRFFLIT